MAFAANQSPNRTYRNLIREQAERSSGLLPRRRVRRREADTIHAAWNDCDTLTCNPSAYQRSGDALGNRSYSVNHIIVEQGREQTVWDIVHPARHDQCSSTAKR